MNRIFQLEPYIGQEEIENVAQAIQGKWITEGPFSEKFLDDILRFTGAKYGVLANNGTLALFLGLLALGIGEGDEVIVPDFSFIASATSVVFAGGTPVFADIDSKNLNIDPSKIEELITPKTKAIMPVHVYGQSANMGEILRIAQKYNLLVIEDAAQGFGVFFNESHVGTIGDVGCISFFADKTITTGEGAVILTNNEDIFMKLKYLRNQGRPNSGTFVHPYLGMNFRMTDLQSAVGVAQIKKFNEIKNIKQKNLDLYTNLLAECNEVRFVEQASYSNLIPFRANIFTERVEDLIDYLERNNIQTRRFFYPLHMQPCLEGKSWHGITKNAESAYKRGISLPIYCGLPAESISYVCNKIVEFFSRED